MTIRRAKRADIEAIMPLFDEAKKFMMASGNETQWTEGYPSRQLVASDIESGDCHVMEQEGEIVGVFTFHIGIDPNYRVIEGEWPETETYGTIHRIASNGKIHGLADASLEYCKRLCNVIRIDTHADNAPMLGWIHKRGFRYCGIIHVSNGTPRLAFQLGTTSR